MLGLPVLIEPHERTAIVEHAFGRAGVVVRVAALSGGLINHVERLTLADGRDVILRVAPDDAAADAGPSWYTSHGLRREAAVVALARPALGGLLPETIAHDFDRTIVDRDWVIQRRMPGVPLATVDTALPGEERTAVWLELGDLTRRLHDIRASRFGPPVDGPQFDSLSDLLRCDADGLRRDAERFDLPGEPFQRLRDCVETIAGILDDNDGPRMVHSDLARSHVFVDRVADGSHRIVGVIDLEFGRFADPGTERLITSFGWGNAPMEMKETFFRGYGRRFDTPEERRRLELFVAIAVAWPVTILACQGRRTDLPAVIAHMERALDGRIDHGVR